MFCRELYLDEYTSKHFHSIRKKLKNRTIQPGIYVMVLSKDTGRVEYMHNAFLCQKYYAINPPFIIGIAHSKESIMEMVKTIVDETFLMRGDYNFYEYLREKTDKISNKKLGLHRFTVIDREGKKR